MGKTENLMLYVCDKLKTEETFGSTVFNKVLYYIDNISYLKNGDKISDFKYVKQAQGPTPSPNQFMAIRESLIDSNKLKVEEKEYWGKTKKVPTNRVAPTLDVFNDNEMQVINEVINLFKKINGSTASNVSHTEISWDIAENREELPLYTFLLGSEDVNLKDVKWAKSVLDVHN